MKTQGFTFLQVDDDEELLKETYKLRYEIYCHEMNFLNEEDYPECIEKDEYDDFSLHFAALNDDLQVIGTIRLILNSDYTFPLEKFCYKYDKSKINFHKDHIGEISRLCVKRNYRRRKNDGLYGMTSYHAAYENVSEELLKNLIEKRTRPIIVFGLYKVLYMKSKRIGLTHWYAAMEKNLRETLRKFSFIFQVIGPEHDYYGLVAPHLGKIRDIETILYREKPLVMHLMAMGLESLHMPKLDRLFYFKHIIITYTARMVGKM